MSRRERHEASRATVVHVGYPTITAIIRCQTAELSVPSRADGLARTAPTAKITNSHADGESSSPGRSQEKIGLEIECRDERLTSSVFE